MFLFLIDFIIQREVIQLYGHSYFFITCNLLFFKIGKSKIFYTVLFLKRKLTSNVIKLVVKNVETKNKKTVILVIQKEIIQYFDHSRFVKN